MADAIASLRDLFMYVSELEPSLELRGSLYVAPWITVFHVLAIAMFAGTILMMDLRLLGRASMSTPFSQVQRRLFPWQMVGITLATITGLALVFANPMNYFANIIFWTKMFSMAIAGLNAIAFHFITEYTVVKWDTAPRTPFGAKVAGALSVLLWINVVIAGRLIPYASTWITQVE